MWSTLFLFTGHCTADTIISFNDLTIVWQNHQTHARKKETMSMFNTQEDPVIKVVSVSAGGGRVRCDRKRIGRAVCAGGGRCRWVREVTWRCLFFVFFFFFVTFLGMFLLNSERLMLHHSRAWLFIEKLPKTTSCLSDQTVVILYHSVILYLMRFCLFSLFRSTHVSLINCLEEITWLNKG